MDCRSYEAKENVLRCMPKQPAKTIAKDFTIEQSFRSYTKGCTYGLSV